MADKLFAQDGVFPGFTGQETQEERLDRITDYIYQLSEQYRYLLSRLELTDDDAP